MQSWRDKAIKKLTATILYVRYNSKVPGIFTVFSITGRFQTFIDYNTMIDGQL